MLACKNTEEVIKENDDDKLYISVNCAQKLHHNIYIIMLFWISQKAVSHGTYWLSWKLIFTTFAMSVIRQES